MTVSQKDADHLQALAEMAAKGHVITSTDVPRDDTSDLSPIGVQAMIDSLNFGSDAETALRAYLEHGAPLIGRAAREAALEDAANVAAEEHVRLAEIGGNDPVDAASYAAQVALDIRLAILDLQKHSTRWAEGK